MDEYDDNGERPKTRTKENRKERVLANDGDIFTTLDINRAYDDDDEDNDREYFRRRKRYIAASELTPYEFKSEEDIARVVDSLVAEAKDAYIYPVTYVYNVRKMIQYGLWPTTMIRSGPFTQDWLNGIDLHTIEFWHGSDDIKLLENISDTLRWEYKTLETLKREAIENANGMMLRMYAPELVYRVSNRPRTDMSLFRSPISYRIYRDQIVNNTISLNGEEWNVIPVTRYSKGMKRGLFFEKGESDTQEHCGTFYYHDEGSTTLLAYKTYLKTFNKTDAMKKLGEDLPKDDSGDKWVRFSRKGIKKHINGTYPRNLILTPEKALWFREDYDSDTESEGLQNVSFGKHYAGNYLQLYAAEDYLDQPLCLAAKENDIDIIILENMIGSFQIVTEILDTRSREESFRSLVYIVG